MSDLIDEFLDTLSDKNKSFYIAHKLLFIGFYPLRQDNCEKHFIYSLIDPTNNEVRYVGQTSNPKRRYAGHLYNKRGTSKKLEWLALLRTQKLKPEMKILEEVDEVGKTLERERRWIFHMVKKGSVLFQREFFTNPYLMKEVSLTKNVDFLTAELSENFWQRLIFADSRDTRLSRVIMKKLLKKHGNLATVNFSEEVRKEYEKRTGEFSLMLL